MLLLPGLQICVFHTIPRMYIKKWVVGMEWVLFFFYVICVCVCVRYEKFETEYVIWWQFFFSSWPNTLLYHVEINKIVFSFCVCGFVISRILYEMEIIVWLQPYKILQKDYLNTLTWIIVHSAVGINVRKRSKEIVCGRNVVDIFHIYFCGRNDEIANNKTDDFRIQNSSGVP